MKKSIYISIFACATLSMFSCKTDSKNDKNLTKEITFTKEGELSLFDLKDSIPNPITKLDIEIADSDYERETGLMYRKSMQNDQGMLFIFSEEAPHSFYMKNTKFPLDIIFIDAKNKVVSIQKNAQPLNESSLPSEGPAQYVLEVNAKLTDTWNLKAGDSISFTKM
ncbi:uncharacterized membrane protein (UPF0127 family) [Aquimarina sp. EL_43]|uniref:DUF192 domain-containing protein n=1 Tax=Aquimarina TaxID=290174 RepID=UPI0004713621|nr:MULTISPECIES: DUF192 domain-containing protein [Aquimarina]MBG6128605.1 uncharacterized membrane protein (UPF0127 family) [Aquimarina sp. EL_35]MBG6149668.1 uncharacterized membrane protein (UPF0127 family) [Aquimarina sp. EL_32]MBG6167647.1 uncharacterized membrane protein (UPF0127 family) [Aquimarina sp. EL_43]